MASTSHYRPWRVLTILAVLVVGLVAWAFFPGANHAPRLGLDLQGGSQVTLLPKSAPGQEGTITQEQIDQAVSIIRQRVNGLGVSEAEVTTQGSGASSAIVVSVPGSVPQDRLVELVGRTALLDFRAVETILNPTPAGATPSASPTPAVATPTPTTAVSPSATPASPAAVTPTPTATQSASPSPSASPTGVTGPPDIPIQAAANDAGFQAALAKLDCSKPENHSGGAPDVADQWLGTCDRDGTAKFSLQPAFIRGTDITDAQAQLDPQTSTWAVSLTFNDAGSKKLAQISADIYQKTPPQNQFAIVLDSIVYSAPQFLEPIGGGQAQITGDFSAQEAGDLANVLKYGSLPVTLEVAQVSTVSPTLGTDYLMAGLLAGAIGLVLVAIYLIGYYRALGVVAVVSLVLAGLITYSLFVVFGRVLGFTLTLAGIAGAIVSIGITADSFIVYFERIRDEIRDGRTLRVAAEAGWIRARRTLLAADFVSLLGAVVLYLLSIGSVRGFAFALGITTLVDVFVAFLFTRPVVAVLARTDWFRSGNKWTGVDPARLGMSEEQASSIRMASSAGRR